MKRRREEDPQDSKICNSCDKNLNSLPRNQYVRAPNRIFMCKKCYHANYDSQRVSAKRQRRSEESVAEEDSENSNDVPQRSSGTLQKQSETVQKQS